MTDAGKMLFAMVVVMEIGAVLILAAVHFGYVGKEPSQLRSARMQIGATQ